MTKVLTNRPNQSDLVVGADWPPTFFSFVVLFSLARTFCTDFIARVFVVVGVGLIGVRVVL